MNTMTPNDLNGAAAVSDEQDAFEADLLDYFTKTQPDRVLSIEAIREWRGRDQDYAGRPVVFGMWMGWNRRALVAAGKQADAAPAEPAGEREALLELDVLLAEFHAAVWHAGAGDDGPVDYDMAGVEEVKAIRQYVRSLIARAARTAPAEPATPEALPVKADSDVSGSQVAADLAFSVFSGLNALRWLLNITTEFDRKDVRTRQAARLLDDYIDSFGKTGRQRLEDMWKKLNEKLPDDGRINEYLRAHDAASRELSTRTASTAKQVAAAQPANGGDRG